MKIKIVDIKQHENQEVGKTDWISVDQKTINAFGKLSGDNQWIHTDPEKCAKLAPTKTTIVHGNYWLTILSKYIMNIISEEGVVLGLNYGYNKVRFIESVKVNEEIQMTFVVSDIKEETGRTKFTIATTLRRKSDLEIVAYIEALCMIILK